MSAQESRAFYVEAPSIPEGMTIAQYRAGRKKEAAAFKRLCMKMVKACSSQNGQRKYAPTYREWLLDNVGNAAGGGPRKAQA